MEIKEALAALAALAHETRLAVYRLLIEAGPKGLAVGDISERLELAPATLSFHLAQLRRAGLVDSRREGRTLYQRADFAAMNGLVAYLTENCCGGGESCVGVRPGTARFPSKQSRATVSLARRRSRSR